MEKNKNIKKIISRTPSNWKEQAKFIRENPWLEYSSQIARRLIMIIKDKNLTQAQLAEMIKGKRQQVNRILQGKENLTLKTIYNLSRALDYELITFPAYRYQQKETKTAAITAGKVVSMPKTHQTSKKKKK